MGIRVYVVQQEKIFALFTRQPGLTGLSLRFLATDHTRHALRLASMLIAERGSGMVAKWSSAKLTPEYIDCLVESGASAPAH